MEYEDTQKTFYSASADGYVKAWKEVSAASGRSQAKFDEVASFSCSNHEDGVVDLSVHPLGIVSSCGHHNI